VCVCANRIGTERTNDDLARELDAAKAHITELEAAQPDRGSLFNLDLKNDKPDNIAEAIIGNVDLGRAEKIARAILKAVKPRVRSRDLTMRWTAIIPAYSPDRNPDAGGSIFLIWFFNHAPASQQRPSQLLHARFRKPLLRVPAISLVPSIARVILIWLGACWSSAVTTSLRD
jgi:hypothetical protein